MLRTTLTTAALTASLVVGTAGAASAHECFVVKRSDKGAVAATHSANWMALPLDELLGHMGFAGEDLRRMSAEAQARGVPSTFAMFMHHTIPGSLSEAQATDGKGIDHLDEFIPVFFQIAKDLGIAVPPPPPQHG